MDEHILGDPGATSRDDAQARREGGCDGCARTPPPADC